MCTDRSRPERGFTLLEILVALTILSVVLATVYGAVSRTLFAKEYAEGRAELYAAGREAVLKIAEEMEAALPPSPGSNVSFRGLNRGDRSPADAVQFSVRTHSGLQPTTLRSGRSTITYSLDPIGDRDRVFILRRDDVPLITAPPDTESDTGQAEDAPPPPKPTTFYLLDESDCTEQRFCAVSLSFHYLDPVTGDWVNEWDSTEPAQLNKLPAAAQITLNLADNNGALHEFSTIVDLVLAAGSLPTPTPGRTTGGR